MISFALLYFARINNDKGKAQEALEYGNRLIKLKKNQGKAYLEYGRSLMLLSKNEEALSAFNEASRYMPDDPQPDIYLGDLNFNLKRYSKASAHYLKVIDMDPDNVDAYLKAAKSTEMAGDSRNAYELLKKIAPKYTNHGVLQRELGVLGLINGDTAKAKITGGKCQSGTADDRVLMGLGWCFIREKDYEKAFSHFTK
jgi:tetratricopeptide (TPR) repeat protein